jgi:hypothetical protein
MLVLPLGDAPMLILGWMMFSIMVATAALCASAIVGWNVLAIEGG